jgi:gliding motility associated protien GldN
MKKLILSIFLTGLFLSPALVMGQITDNTPVDGLYQNQGLVNRVPIPLPSIRKADIMWSKRIWRVIDFRQKMNNVFYFPTVPQQNWKSFITVIMDALKQGEITAYDISSTDELLVPITYNEIIARQTDTIHKMMRRPYPPYNEYDTIIITRFDPTQVLRLRLKEDWYFDSKRSQMLVRIEAFCPVMLKEHNGQQVPVPLFWVSYADARKVLARALAFNPYNSAARLSFDDIFIKRLFRSYIYKEQNIFGRRISAYATGVNAIRESQRIKNQMFNFEQYLWQY